MKKLIGFLLFIISFDSYSQRIVDDYGHVEVNPDSQKVMMLCSDTTYIPNFTFSMLHTGDTSLIKINNRLPYFFWIFGYHVFDGVWADKDGYITLIPEEYLDADKKPLPKSVIVWQSKEVK